jgi:hypothetical protein
MRFGDGSSRTRPRRVAEAVVVSASIAMIQPYGASPCSRGGPAGSVPTMTKPQHDGQWRVGAVTITSVVEAETPGIPPELFFPTGSAAEVAAETWLIPDYAAPDGTIGMRVQALFVETPSTSTRTWRELGKTSTRV